MATTRFWPIKTNLKRVIDYAANTEKTVEVTDEMKTVVDYATNHAKTNTEEKLYVTGVNCFADSAFENFKWVRDFYKKDGEILGYHGYMSFAPGEVTADEAHKIGVEFAERNFPGFQVVVATHLNTNAIHNHFVVNSVCMKDGHMAHDEVTWFKVRGLVDQIMKEHSLSVIENPNRTHDMSKRDRIIHDKLYRADEDAIRAALDVAISKSRTKEELKNELSAMGYYYNLSKNRKYWTITPKGSKKAFRLYHLGNNYTNDAIEKRLQSNMLYGVKTGQVKRLAIVKFIGKDFMVVRLFRHYKYVLDTILKNRNQTVYLPHAVKADVDKLQKISEEIRFMERENLEFDSDVENYKAILNDKLKQLLKKRQRINNRLAKKDCTNEKSLRYELSAVNDEIKIIRNENKMCDDILKRSKQMYENILEIDKESGVNGERDRYRNIDHGRDGKTGI